MAEPISTSLRGPVVEETLQLTLLELCQASGAPQEQISLWVIEGVLQPAGQVPHEWRFGGASLRRTRLAYRLSRDLEINPSGVALALDLLEEIQALRAQLGRYRDA